MALALMLDERPCRGRLYALLCFAVAAAAARVGHGQVVIAVGDSITEGVGASDSSRTWVSVMSSCRGQAVLNFGVSGATMQRQSDLPYWSTAKYREALASSPDVVFLMLGTNDAKSHNWNPSRFREDALSLVRSFVTLPSSPRLYLSSPPPLFDDGVMSMMQNVINQVIPPILQEVASESGPRVTYLDAVFNAFGGQEMSCQDCMYSCLGLDQGDGCHPLDFGHAQIALALCAAAVPTCACPPLATSPSLLSVECLRSRLGIVFVSVILAAAICFVFLYFRGHVLFRCFVGRSNGYGGVVRVDNCRT